MEDAEVGRHLQEAFAFFDSAWLLEGGAPSSRVALMRTRDFLGMAPPPAARIESHERFAVIDGLMKLGTPFSSPLELLVDADGDEAVVYSHDGRHRAMRLLDRIEFVPVHVVVDAPSEGKPRDDVLDGIVTVYPQTHDEDEDYPGWDAEDLDARIEPMAAKDAFVRVLRVEEVAAMLGLATTPTP